MVRPGGPDTRGPLVDPISVDREKEKGGQPKLAALETSRCHLGYLIHQERRRRIIHKPARPITNSTMLEGSGTQPMQSPSKTPVESRIV